MKKTILSVLFAFACSFCFSQALSGKDFLEDLEFLRKNLPVKHANLFAKISQQDFDAKIDAIAAKANGLDYETFAAELFKLTVNIRDEHTFIEPTYTRVLPIRFERFKEGLFVTGIDPENSALLRCRLAAINSTSTSGIVTAFKEAIQSENPSYFEDHFLRLINNPAFLKGLRISDSDLEAEFTLIDQDGRQVRTKLASVPQTGIGKMKLAYIHSDLLAEKEKGNYWFDYDSGKKTLYFNYNECREDKDKPFAQFNDELFEVIDSRRPDKIVLDLRDNNGGNSGVLNPFMERIKHSYLNQKGKFFVLIGKRTFSSAVMNAVELKKNSNAIFIGEPTSGNINHYGEVRGFSLPKSKIVIAYSTRYWETWKGKKGPLKPDVPVTYSIKNYLEGKDEALTQVYKY
ncbi:S41 family peptidase [Pedobacter sp. JY14-1]|uniref:S41 family peptidase n=1 Tax=Pedobacter sp. JY14-1 TaxID=3034151 RepID=UPI0023E11EF0|nr:S41 family peptidase [Pedobacter sp. JY14-1]